MKWKPTKGALRPANAKSGLFRLFTGVFAFLFAFFVLPVQSISALEEIKDSTDLSQLNIHKFDLNVNNVSVLSKSSAIDQVRLTNPNYEYLGQVYPGEMENFTIKVDKSKKEDQVFDKPLALKFTNVGTVQGKQVDAYLTFNKVQLNYLHTATAEAQMNNAQKDAVEFFSISELWEKSAFEIGNIPYVDAAHDNIMNKAFSVNADVTAELRYADGSDTDLKLVMKPTDIDVVDHLGLKESFYINDYRSAVDKRLMNAANALSQVDKGSQTVWEATTSTSGSYNENNISGLAVRSTSNQLNFGYLSTEACSAVFGLYIEQINPEPALEVNPEQMPAKAGQTVTYKGTFKLPVPGKDILATPSTMEMIEKFDERLDYKSLTVASGGRTLQENQDYTIEQSGQTVTVKMTPVYLQTNPSQDIVITYQTETNQKVSQKGAPRIENTVTMKVDNLQSPSNKVSTSLLYEKSHEFVSGTAGKELPQEVKDLTPATEKNLADGSQVTPTNPAKTEVKTADGTWTFKSYDKSAATIAGADVKFVGTWEFTPTPTYKATHEFVSGTAGKELPQEVKTLLPADQSYLADGTKVTPTTPSPTEVQVSDGTWTFKSYDKTEVTIAGADVKFVGTWEFTATPAPTPTYKATHEFVSGTTGKELSQEVKALLPADQSDLADGSKATPTAPSTTEVQVSDGTWTFKSYDKTEATIAGADVKFVGTWEFTATPAPTPTYKAVHEFVSGTTGKELPQEVKNLLPADQSDLADGSKATPTAPSTTEVQVSDGTWTFKSYDKSAATIAGADVKFVGTWEFTPTPTYKALHEFVSGTTGKELPQEVKNLLPADQSDLADGSKVTPTAPSTTEVTVSDGTWTFKSYDKADATIVGADVKFVGTWEFTPTPTYKATHEFISGTAGKELPQEVKALLPADQTNLTDGSQVTPTNPAKTEVKTADGTWTFKSYDKTEATIAGADVKFVGTWEFVATPTPSATTSLSGRVIWLDDNNSANKRPQSLTIYLLADGQETGTSVTVSQATGWTYSFDNLPRYKDGKEIAYAVRTAAIEGYESQTDGFTITNRSQSATADDPAQESVDSIVTKPGKQKILPRTGEKSSLLALVLGLLSLLGLAFRLKKKA